MCSAVTLRRFNLSVVFVAPLLTRLLIDYFPICHMITESLSGSIGQSPFLWNQIIGHEWDIMYFFTWWLLGLTGCSNSLRDKEPENKPGTLSCSHWVYSYGEELWSHQPVIMMNKEIWELYTIDSSKCLSYIGAGICLWMHYVNICCCNWPNKESD